MSAHLLEMRIIYNYYQTRYLLRQPSRLSTKNRRMTLDTPAIFRAIPALAAELSAAALPLRLSASADDLLHGRRPFDIISNSLY
ncbi:hypothetical protein [Mesorhizobium sp.]|uniref:hypothetical protein n=1 Tax=Mesorhizobium sp. TaxID=1871066 RepID=UPI0025E38ED0|nr:hypothetical protein [Mesorhizobium sp.]